MQSLLNKYIIKSQAQVSDEGEGIEEAIVELKKGLRILLMRPDTDATKNSLILKIQMKSSNTNLL